MRIHRAITMLFLVLLSAGLVSAEQAPVTDLVLRLAENQNDIILNWTRPLNADSFRVYSYVKSDFQIADSLQIGTTQDTTFSHLNALADSEQRFYVVVAVAPKMVLVPAGLYTMGSDVVGGSATPEHQVYLDAYYIDINEVTNAEYKAFCDATSRAYPPDPGFPGMPNYFTSTTYSNHPVVNVSWYDARFYAAWAGKRLPSEAEWERAAKGNADNRLWPWGDTWIGANANVYDDAEDGYTFTSPVGNYPNGISPAGCYDMAGNVWEWCEDDWHYGYDGAPVDGRAWIDTPRHYYRVIRGGLWANLAADARCAVRDAASSPEDISIGIGFRCAKSVENRPPTRPSLPSPADSIWNQSINVDLSWTCSDPDLGPLTYDVYFGTASTPLVNSGQTATTYDPGTLASGTTYYWQIVAFDNHEHSTSGPVWSFSTAGFEGMVLVPAGEFTMGRVGVAEPEHQVYLDAYYIDIYEVTNAQYKAFCDATAREYPPDPGFSGMPDYFTRVTYANHPVVMVYWQDAVDYATWAGKRLPTEAEWERAAKGNMDNRQWPWGDTWVATNANIYDNPADGYEYTSPVGNYPSGISPAGCYDMAGNVWEWCHDWYADYTSDYQTNPQGPPTGYNRISRGASWDYGGPDPRCANRNYYNLAHRYSKNGFRCARTP